MGIASVGTVYVGFGTVAADFDGDGVLACAGDCNDNSAAVNPGALEICDGIDNNCDSVLAPGREQTIQGLIQVIAQTHKALFDVELDPYIFRTLIVGIEGLTLHTCRNGAPNAEERARVQAAVQHVLRSVLAPADAT